MSGAPTSLPRPMPLGPELFIGLVTPVGVDHAQLTSILIDTLAGFNYKTRVIRIASLLRAFGRYKLLASEQGLVDSYIREHQLAGNDFRDTTKRNDAMAILGIGQIQQERQA